MIYLVKAAYLIKDSESIFENDTYESVFKVGYAKEIDNRYKVYRTENVSCKLIKTREGDSTLEYMLHLILRGLGLNINLGREWYKLDPKVVEIFEESYDDLRKRLWINRENYFPPTIFKVNHEGEKKEFRSIGHKIFEDLFEEFVSEEEKVHYGEEFYITEDGEIVSNKVFDIDILYRKISDERAWEVSQREYQDNITVTKSIENLNGVTTSSYISPESKLVSNFLDKEFFSTGIFKTRMRAYCKFRDNHAGNSILIDELNRRIRDQKYSRYYEFYGSGGCGSRRYEEKNLREGLKMSLSLDKLGDYIYNTFKVGDKYPMPDIKSILGTIFFRT